MNLALKFLDHNHRNPCTPLPLLGSLRDIWQQEPAHASGICMIPIQLSKPTSQLPNCRTAEFSAFRYLSIPERNKPSNKLNT